MSPIIHAQLGWLCGSRLERKRDRVLVTACAVVPDLDGLGLLVSEDLYIAWHHRLAHGALWLLFTALLGFAISRRAEVAAWCVAAFGTHVLADLAGSGPGWPVMFWWPFSDVEWLPSWQWDLASWPNAVIGLAVTFTSLGCALWLGRTPAELLGQRADRAVVSTLRARFNR